MPADPDLRWAALFHDVDKLATRSEDGSGKVMYWHHEELGGWIARGILARLMMPVQRLERIVFIVSHHGRVNAYERQWSDRAVARLDREMGAGLADLRRDGAARSPMSGPLLFPDRRVKTANGRVQLIDREPDPVDVPEPAPVEAGSGVLWLFSNSTEKSQASQWAGKGLGERTWVVVHPDAAPGLAAGDVVRVVSAYGEVEAELRLDAEQRSDVAIMPKGGHYDRAQSANALIEARPTDLGLGAAYLDCFVRLAPKR